MKAATIFMFVAAAALVTVSLLGQEHHHGTDTTKEQMIPEECEKMMEMHGAMMSGMDAMDSEMVDLINNMNSTQGNEKLDAMAKVVNKLVEQRKHIHKNMMSYHSGMMQHMGNHMGMAMTQDSMMEPGSHCPMAKGMMMRGKEEEKGNPHH